MAVKIIADSTCDLSKELIERYDITIVPLHVILGEQEYKDGEEIGPDEIYRWSDEHKTTPKTSAVSVTDMMDALETYREKADGIVCFSISEQMSMTANAMRMAAEEVDAEVFVVESANLSTGIGLLVIEAAIMAQQGKSAGEIAEAIEKLKPMVRSSFVVDTLVYLHRGGRCSGVAALAGGALRLHPKIVVENGAMRPDKKYRGKIGKVILDYVKDMEPQLRNAKRDRVFITHSGCDDEVVSKVKQYLESLQIFEEILITQAGGVIASHCGPGTLGVLFIENE